MNRVLIALGLAALTVLGACEKIKDLLNFSIANESSFTVSSTTPINSPYTINTPDVTTNSSQEFENNNTNAKLVKEVKLKSLTLTITNPSQQNFNFLKTIRIYISSTNSNEIELASLESVPAGVSSIVLTPTNSRLDEYIKADKYSLRTEVVTDEVLTHDVSIRCNSVFSVAANL